MTYRDCCGSLKGLIAHQSAGEDPCGFCAQAEAAAAVTAESVPRSRSVSGGVLTPVTPEQAAVNAALLLGELDVFEAAHPYWCEDRYLDADELAARREQKRGAA